MVNDQPRNQHGQFGNKLLQEPVGATTALSVYDREDATFEYPSLASSARYCINFWSSVRIPDGVYTQFHNEHHLQRVSTINTDEIRATVQKDADDIYFEWGEANPEDAQDAELSAQKWQEIVDEVRSNIVGPPMDPRDAPVIARAALMFHNAPGEQFVDEREMVLNHEVQLVGGMTTIAEVAEAYRTDEIYWSVSQEPQRRDVEQSSLIDAINELKHSVDTMANNTDLSELTVQQKTLIDELRTSTKLQEPVAKLAEIQLRKSVSEVQDTYRERSQRNIELAAQRREARGEKR